MFFLESVKSLLGQAGQLVKRFFVHGSEIEARFALHAFLQAGGNAFEQIRKHIHRHQMVAHVVLLDLHRAEEQLFFIFLRKRRVEGVISRLVTGIFNREWTLKNANKKFASIRVH
jgi:hypothetical protein